MKDHNTVAHKTVGSRLRALIASLPCCEIVHHETKADEAVKVIVAVSGGKDSISLLSIVCAECNEIHDGQNITPHIELIAAYVNHGEQDEQARADEYNTVVRVCDIVRAPLRAVSIIKHKQNNNTPAASEDTLRRARYNALYDIAVSAGARCIITAHHADDVCETIIMRLFSSGGWQGMAGIPPIRTVRMKQRDTVCYVLRPALHLTQTELHRYADALHKKNNSIHPLPYHQDAGNKLIQCGRNTVRNAIIPRVEKHFPEAHKRVSHFAENMGMLTSHMRDSVPPWLKSDECAMYPTAVYDNLPRVLKHCALYAGANAVGVSAVPQRFTDKCIGALACNGNTVRIGSTVLVRRKKFLVWRVSRNCSLEAGENNCYLYNTDGAPSKVIEIAENGIFIKYCTDTNDRVNGTCGGWTVQSRNSMPGSDSGIWYMVQSPGLLLRLLRKKDTIVQKKEHGNKQTVSLPDAVGIPDTADYSTVPVLYDTRGIACAAGEVFLGKTIMRDTIVSKQELSTYAVMIQYHALSVTRQLV